MFVLFFTYSRYLTVFCLDALRLTRAVYFIADYTLLLVGNCEQLK